MRRPAAPNVMLVLGSRPSGRARLEEWLPQLELEVERLELGPLPLAVCEEFARARLVQGDSLATAVASESGGVPIFLLELLQHAATRHPVAVAGISLDDLMRARIAALPAGPPPLPEIGNRSGRRRVGKGGRCGGWGVG